MFNIGDSIVYPGQGVGKIEKIEQMEFQGEVQDYYTIVLENSSMKLTMPSSRAGAVNMRLVSDYETIVDSLNNIERYITDSSQLKTSNYKSTIDLNSLKAKSGTLDNFLEVICTLTKLKSQKKLNMTDKKILDSTKNIFIQEIVHSNSLTVQEATSLVDNAIKF